MKKLRALFVSDADYLRAVKALESAGIKTKGVVGALYFHGLTFVITSVIWVFVILVINALNS